jgi:DNA-binding response OmpR family regulator
MSPGEPSPASDPGGAVGPDDQTKPQLTVLLVEDDPRIRQALSLALNDQGCRAIPAGTGEDALRLLSGPAHSVDIILLDVMLPGLDGFEVCRQIRQLGDLPIIMVTARTDSADVIAGLEAGADDYVTKPLVASELVARIHALLRRARSTDRATSFTVGDLLVEPEQARAARGPTQVHLTKTELRLLCELAYADGRVVSRERLLERVWNYGYFGDTRLLDVHIRRLRRKVEQDPSRPRYILTIRGHGYRLVMS